MRSKLELKLEALARAGELIRPTFQRMRSAIAAGEATEFITRLTKKDVIRICQWKYDWKTLYRYLIDKYGMYYINQGPKEKRVYTFKINVLHEVAAGTTCLLTFEADKFLDLLIAGRSSEDQPQPRAPRKLKGTSSGTALMVARDYAEATKYLKHLKTLALKTRQNLDVELPILFEADAMFLGEVDGFEQDDPFARKDTTEDAYIDDIDYFEQGDAFAREGDIDEDDPLVDLKERYEW